MNIRRNIILILQKDHSQTKEQCETPSQVESIEAVLGCSCQKTGCLKLYCACFKDGKACGETCACASCKNALMVPERGQAILKMIRKYKNNFVQKFEKNTQLGCNCKRSKCQQKYCECFIRGQECISSCKCKKCKNGKLDLKIQKLRVDQAIPQEDIQTNSAPNENQ